MPSTTCRNRSKACFIDVPRSDPKTQPIPIIMLTGVESVKIYPVIERLANVSHIKKPVSLEDLLSMVHAYIRDSE